MIYHERDEARKRRAASITAFRRGNRVWKFRSMAVPGRGVLRLALVTARRAVIIWSDDRSGMKIATAAERPELLGPVWDRTQDTLPEYNNHSDVLNEYWPRLTEERPDFQFHLTGDDEEILARARSIPLHWDGTLEDLPAGIDGAIARGFDEAGANVLCALVIMFRGTFRAGE